MAAAKTTYTTIDPNSLGKNVTTGTQYDVTQKSINKNRVEKYGIDSTKGLTDEISYIPIDDTTAGGKSETTTTDPVKVNVDTIVEKSTKEPQGQKIIGISPFDNYYLFNIFTEKGNMDMPLDLSNAGTIYISFHQGNEEVKIANYTLAGDYADISQGQVIFKITKEDAKKVLGYTNNNFYITSQKQTSNSTSDETVIYLGKFYPYDQLYENTLQAEYDAYKITAQTQILQLQSALSQLDMDYTGLQKKYNESLATNDKLQKQLDLYKNIIDKYKKYLSAEQLAILNKELGIISGNDITPGSTVKVKPPTVNTNTDPPVGGKGGDPNLDPQLINYKKNFANTSYNTKIKEQ